MNYCVIIPTYNNDKTLEGVISEVYKITQDVILINDGSTDNTSEILKKFTFLKTISFPANKGKGAAIRKGLEVAAAEGYRYAITIDSDGQHFPSDINLFLKKIEEEPDSLIVGDRNLRQEKLSQGSSFANKLSNFWFRFLTGIDISDTQTGFRLYPLDVLSGMKFYTKKYEFELEVLVRAAWKKINVTSIPISVFYPSREERVSHFRPFRDFGRISLLNTVFAIIALVYVKPFSFLKALTRENIRKFIKNDILLTNDSNLQIALAISLGIFTGIIPLWGFQLLLAISLAHIFKLSKIITSVAANISIPPMIPVILYLSYLTGCIVMRTSGTISFSSGLTVKSFEQNLMLYITGSIVLAIALSIVAGLTSFALLQIFRRKREAIS